jgi:molybdopterin-containing oxidoreductase family iron-sulfur binding subunit
MTTPKRYWMSPDERDRDLDTAAAEQSELGEDPANSGESASAYSRRSFLKLTGFALAGGALTGCNQAPLKKAIPYLVQQEEIVPGRAYWYASTCGACKAGCGVLTKNRDGRPIKLEGNPTHPFSRGGLCAVGQASVLELYDSQRLKAPVARGKESTWQAVDAAIGQRLEQIRTSSGTVRFLSGTMISPTLRRSVDSFLSGFANSKQVEYDSLSASAILEAHAQTHGARVLPHYHFDRAQTIVGFDADFLGTWISPVEFTRGYRRNPEGAAPDMVYHAQLESRLSITGSKADKRIAVAPGEIGAAAAALAVEVAGIAGVSLGLPAVPTGDLDRGVMRELAGKLWGSRGKSLVVCGVNDIDVQKIVNAINQVLGNYGATIDVAQPSYQRQGSDSDLQVLIGEMKSGAVSALFVYGANPAYDLPNSGFVDALKKVNLVVSFSERFDETSSLATHICPDHHFLESWGDAEAVAGVVTLTQPAVRPLNQTRSALESLATWSGNARPAYDIVRDTWRESIFPRQSAVMLFDAFWDKALQDGHAFVDATPVATTVFEPASVTKAPEAAAKGTALVLYPKAGLLDGSHAHNPWLQELPDPISKIAWDNYVAVSPATAQSMNLAAGDVVRVTAKLPSGETSIELPAHIQPGQHNDVVAIALGYGRMGTQRFEKVGPQWLESRPTVAHGSPVGKNAAIFRSLNAPVVSDVVYGVTVTKTGARADLASTQEHHSLSAPKALEAAQHGPRPIVQEATLAAYLKDPEAGAPHEFKGKGLWPDDHKYLGHHWGMTIDLTKCTGCSACVVSCQAENNVPVVGKDEVRRHREMHWIRIDRYYAEHNGTVDVAFQPMLCQHCANAPCETVCPVLATVHSAEGLNQQIYNRCVGTRYCANNCPYKVRRFNWFDYPHEDRLQNMVLNPDVTIRSRGVMEKCSLCVQRIQEAKNEAKRKGEQVRDGDVQPACAQSCPAQAITFGDMNDPKSAVYQTKKDPRHYLVLAELNVQPSVGYLRLIRNREEQDGGHDSEHNG